MAKDKENLGAESGKIGDALRGMGEGAEARHVSASEIGGHPAEEEESILAMKLNVLGPSNLDRAIFCRQLATMIEVGIPLLRALKLLSKRTQHRRLANAIADVANEVEEGQSVSQAMEKHERTFSPIVCRIVRIGEIGGILEDSLVRLAQIMEMKAEIRRKIRSAMMYPCIALTVAFLVIVVIMVKAVPVFSKVYADSQNELPTPTQWVIAISHFTSHYLYIWVPLLIAAIVGLVLYLRTPGGKRVHSWLSLRVPVVGRVTQKIAVARFARTLGGLLRAGVPLIEGLQITADTNENHVVSKALGQVQAAVERGERMSGPLARAGIFPPMVVDMISIGEETGTLDRMLEKIADIYDADVDSTLRGLTSILEPLLIVCLGGVVIFIALAVMLPYFNLVDVVGA